MAEVKLDGVGKTYPSGVVAVSSASFDIADGEFIVLVGPSGCGKSTMLRMIAGLEEITEGTVSIGGRTVNGLEPGDRDIAMVFQNYALYPHMSVRGNMAYGLKNQGMSKPDIETRIAEAARFLQLEPYLDRKPRELSGGQRQRVAMGRAIVREPAVFLLDEPLSNLDAKLRTQLRAELKQLHRRLDATFIYVTHDQIEAMSLADRIVIMSEGRIEQIGTPMDLYARPASTFVAEFIGAPPMNVLPIGSDAAKGIIPSHWDARQDIGFIGIRPEHLRLEASGISANVVMVEPLGADTLVQLNLAGEKVVLRGDGDIVAHLGPTVCVKPDHDAIRIFDKEGRAIDQHGLS